MMRFMNLKRAVLAAVLPLPLALACSSSSSAPAPLTGQTCSQTSQCYSGLDAAALHGQVTCLTQLQNGYCTHTCTADTDCCAVPGECPSGAVETCAPLTSAPQTYCFLSCEATDIAAANAGTTDANVYCQRFANPTFNCHSTGGGSANKKFCGP
jgi:hypothetical protein